MKCRNIAAPALIAIVLLVAMASVSGLSAARPALATAPTGGVEAPGIQIVLYVSAAATGANNGFSWADAYTSLQSALAAAVSGQSIWVAQGIYMPVSDTTQTTSFAMKAGVSIYGGFAATETVLAQRDWRLHETILSGEIGAAGNGDNSYHVVTAGSGVTTSARLDGFTITGGNASVNDAIHGLGGGMRVQDASPTLVNLIFVGNTALAGGGMAVFQTAGTPAPRIINSTFRGNTTAGFGGAIWMGGNTAPRLQNVLVHGNSASYDGGGLYANGSSPILAGVTVYGNSAGQYGGGFYSTGFPCATVTGSIFWGNSAWIYPQVRNESCGTFSLTYSIVQGGFSGTGNSSADPLFVDSASDNLRLQAMSPATDSGANASVMADLADLDGDGNVAEATPFDLDGNPRFYDDPAKPDTGTGTPPIVDRGAYEQGRTCYVRLNDSPTDYGSVQAAVDAGASASDVVKVAGQCGGVGLRGGITQTVYLSKTLTIRGGYTTSNWTAPDSVANPTTINAGGLGRVFVISGTISPVIEGLRITGGDARGLQGGSPDGEDVGGGIYLAVANATITNNVVYGNAADDGAGITIGESNSTIAANTIQSNVAGSRNGGYGGGISVYGSSPAIFNNIFLSNTAVYSEANSRGGDGGGIQYMHSTPDFHGNTLRGNIASWGGGLAVLECTGGTIDSNAFIDNYSDWSAGGLAAYAFESATIANNEFTGNDADTDAGGLWIDDSVVTVTQNIIVGNEAINGSAGGFRIDSSQGTVIIGNTVMSNTAHWSGAGVFIDGGPLLISNTIMYNHGNDGAGIHLADGNPVLWSNTVSRNEAWWQGGGIKIEGGSAVFSNTLITYNKASGGGAGIVANDAAPTFVNPVVIFNDVIDTGEGAAIWVNGSRLTLLHPTITDNECSSGPGYGVYLEGSQSVVTMTNAIVASQLAGVYAESDTAATIDGVLWYDNDDDTGGPGSIIVTHPYTGSPAFLPDGYHITAGSAAINQGVAVDVAVDIDGQPRTLGAPDLGADEFSGLKIYLPLVARDL